jgi:hypothetical protein
VDIILFAHPYLAFLSVRSENEDTWPMIIALSPCWQYYTRAAEAASEANQLQRQRGYPGPPAPLGWGRAEPLTRWAMLDALVYR